MSSFLENSITSSTISDNYNTISPAITQDKTTLLQERKQEKIQRLNPRANLEDSYTQLEDGSLESNKNKIWNSLSDPEYQNMYSQVMRDYTLVKGDDGKTRFAATGEEYTGPTSWFYQGTAKQGDAYKLGINRGDKHYRDRYIPNGLEGKQAYGWESGPEGINPETMGGVLLPQNAAVTLEGITHGREAALANRVAMSGDQDAKTRLGSGYTEYYKGPQGALGDTSQDANVSEQAMKEQWQQWLGQTQTQNPRGGIADKELYKKYLESQRQNREADRMGVGDRLLNAVKAFPTAVVKELGLDTADWVGETLKRQTGWGWDVGTDEEKLDMAAGLFGYNKLLQERGVEKAKPYAENLYEAITDSRKDVKMDDVFGLIQAGLETPEMLTYSLGYLASMMVGTNKFSKTGKTISGIEKLLKSGKIDKASAAASVAKVKEAETISQLAGRVAGNNLGFATVVAGNVNDQIDEFKMNNNGVDPTAGQVFRMLGTETVMAGLDRFTDLSILRTPEALKALTSAAKYVPESKAAEVATKVVVGAAKLATAAGVEAAQEYTQTMGEIFNKQFQSDKYGEDALAILTNKDNVIEGIVSAGMGAAMGAEMKGIGMVAEAVASGTTAVANKVMENKAVKTTIETVQDVSKAIDDEITQFTSGASSSQPAVRAEVAGMTEEDVIATENAANNASEETRQAIQLKVLAAMKARAEASQDSTSEVNTAKEILTTTTYRSEDRAAVVDALATLYSNDTKEAVTQETVVRSKLQENNYSVEEIEEVVTEAKALGEALSTFKKVEGVTGKSAKTVSSEVLQEDRSGIAYYSGAMVGIVTGNEQMVEQYANSLNNLTALQSNKIATMDAGIATAKEGLVNDIANKLGVSITNDRYMGRIREYVYGKRPINSNTPAVKRALTELKAEYEKAQAKVSIWKGTVPVNGKLPEFQLNMGSLAESVRDGKPVGGLKNVEAIRREVKALETLQATLQKARVRKVNQPQEKATESVIESSKSNLQTTEISTASSTPAVKNTAAQTSTSNIATSPDPRYSVTYKDNPKIMRDWADKSGITSLLEEIHAIPNIDERGNMTTHGAGTITSNLKTKHPDAYDKLKQYAAQWESLPKDIVRQILSTVDVDYLDPEDPVNSYTAAVKRYHEWKHSSNTQTIPTVISPVVGSVKPAKSSTSTSNVVNQPQEKATESVIENSKGNLQEDDFEYNEVVTKPETVKNTNNVQVPFSDQSLENPQSTKTSNRVNRYELLKDPKTKAAYDKVDKEVKEYTKKVKSLRDDYLKSQESRSKLQEGYTQNPTEDNALRVKEAKLIEAENEYNLKVAEVRLQELEGSRDNIIGNVPMFTDYKEQLELAKARLEQAKAQAEYGYKLDTNAPDIVEFNNNVKVPLDREYARLFNESIARREQSRNSRTGPQNPENVSTPYVSNVDNSVSQIVDEDLSSLDAMADQYVSTEVDTTFDTNVTIDESTIPIWDDMVAEDTAVEKEVYLDANEKVKLYQEYVDRIKAQKAEVADSKEAAYKAMKGMPEEVKSAVAAVVEDPESLIATIAEDVVKSGIISHIDTRIAEQEKLISSAKKRLREIVPKEGKAVKPELRDEVRAILQDNAKSEKAVTALKQLQNNIRNCK